MHRRHRNVRAKELLRTTQVRDNFWSRWEWQLAAAKVLEVNIMKVEQDPRVPFPPRQRMMPRLYRLRQGFQLVWAAAWPGYDLTYKRHWFAAHLLASLFGAILSPILLLRAQGSPFSLEHLRAFFFGF
jgi:hypothetical protein